MNEVLSLGRQARRLGVTKKWLQAEAEAGRVPSLKAGGRYLFDPEAVQKVLHDRAGKGGRHAR